MKEVVLYRHAKPVVSDNKVVSGSDFVDWVRRYNDSGIQNDACEDRLEEIVFTSDLFRSEATGELIGRAIVKDVLFREAETPLIRFPMIRIKARHWLLISRVLWVLGFKVSCESFKDAKQRAKLIVEKIESYTAKHQKMVIVGHGFINRLIKRELLKRRWECVESGNGFLSKSVFRKKITED